MAQFEKISKYADFDDVHLPVRKTACSAGYDFEVAEDVIIKPYTTLMDRMQTSMDSDVIYSIDEISYWTKKLQTKPTLVPTGIKCKLNKNQYLELSIRSSSPLKYWLLLANGVGIVDADYYNNPDNEGEIFFQVINFSPFSIRLHKGDIIGQGIIKTYQTVTDDKATGARLGGFGSTTQ